MAVGEASTPFVGRGRELGVIHAGLVDAARGSRQFVRVIGEPGIGKTTLAARVARQAADEGWAVSWGRAWNASGAPPYWMWQQIVVSVADATGVLDDLDASTIAWLSQIAPEVR